MATPRCVFPVPGGPASVSPRPPSGNRATNARQTSRSGRRPRRGLERVERRVAVPGADAGLGQEPPHARLVGFQPSLALLRLPALGLARALDRPVPWPQTARELDRHHLAWSPAVRAGRRRSRGGHGLGHGPAHPSPLRARRSSPSWPPVRLPSIARASVRRASDRRRRSSARARAFACRASIRPAWASSRRIRRTLRDRRAGTSTLPVRTRPMIPGASPGTGLGARARRPPRPDTPA